MINTIIFDFGDIFINLEKDKALEEFEKLGLRGPNAELLEANEMFERGQIKENQFLETFQKFLSNADIEEIRSAWNAVIGEFPLYRLEFLQLLSTKYRLFLLTNTDQIHISKFEENVGASFFSDFFNVLKKYIIRLKWACVNQIHKSSVIY